MNDQDREAMKAELRMEAELRRTKPAKAPQEFMDRLLLAVPVTPASTVEPRETRKREWWLPWLRWLAPVSAVGLITFVSIKQIPWAVNHSEDGINADDVRISHKLVSSFDAVGKLPGGEPVRFRVREWSDSTVLHDSTRGLVVERSTPRLEVIPVGFDTY
jgi:hypothetical protein